MLEPSEIVKFNRACCVYQYHTTRACVLMGDIRVFSIRCLFTVVLYHLLVASFDKVYPTSQVNDLDVIYWKGMHVGSVCWRRNGTSCTIMITIYKAVSYSQLYAGWWCSCCFKEAAAVYESMQLALVAKAKTSVDSRVATLRQIGRLPTKNSYLQQKPTLFTNAIT